MRGAAGDVAARDLPGVVDVPGRGRDRAGHVECGVNAVAQQEAVRDAAGRVASHDLPGVVDPVDVGQGRAGHVDRVEHEGRHRPVFQGLDSQPSRRTVVGSTGCCTDANPLEQRVQEPHGLTSGVVRMLWAGVCSTMPLPARVVRQSLWRTGEACRRRGVLGVLVNETASPTRTHGNPLCGSSALGLEWRPIPDPALPARRSQMSTNGSVTKWINRLKAGDPEAARRLWEGFFRRLVGLARGKLEGSPRRAADEEDVALSAFGSLCRGAEGGRFPHLLDRDSLWQLLVAITEPQGARPAAARGAAEARRRAGARRGGPGGPADEARPRAGPGPGADARVRRPARRGVRAAARPVSTTRPCGPWRWPNGRASPTRRSPPGSAAPRGRSSGSSR